MRRQKVEINLTVGQSRSLLALIDSAQDAIAQMQTTKYRECARVGDIVVIKILEELSRIERQEQITAGLNRIREWARGMHENKDVFLP